MLGLLTAIGRTDITADTMMMTGSSQVRIEAGLEEKFRSLAEDTSRLSRNDHRHPATVAESTFTGR